MSTARLTVAVPTAAGADFIKSNTTTTGDLQGSAVEDEGFGGCPVGGATRNSGAGVGTQGNGSAADVCNVLPEQIAADSEARRQGCRSQGDACAGGGTACDTNGAR